MQSDRKYHNKKSLNNIAEKFPTNKGNMFSRIRHSLFRFKRSINEECLASVNAIEEFITIKDLLKNYNISRENSIYTSNASLSEQAHRGLKLSTSIWLNSIIKDFLSNIRNCAKAGLKESSGIYELSSPIKDMKELLESINEKIDVISKGFNNLHTHYRHFIDIIEKKHEVKLKKGDFDRNLSRTANALKKLHHTFQTLQTRLEMEGMLKVNDNDDKRNHIKEKLCANYYYAIFHIGRGGLFSNKQSRLGP